MIDIKKLMNLSKDAQYDIIKCKVEVAREALELAKDQPEEVKDVLRAYVKDAETTLEKASWSMR